MNRRHRQQLGPRVQVCDGCCCGTHRKHPGVDHLAIRQRIADAAVESGGGCRTVGCVGECSYSNVVIIRPARAGARRIWVGGVLEDDVIEPLCAWIRGGAVEPPPAKVAAMIFAPAGSSDVTAPVELRSAG